MGLQAVHLAVHLANLMMALGSDTGQGKMPINSELSIRLLVWTRGMQTHWGFSRGHCAAELFSHMNKEAGV